MDCCSSPQVSDYNKKTNSSSCQVFNLVSYRMVISGVEISRDERLVELLSFEVTDTQLIGRSAFSTEPPTKGIINKHQDMIEMIANVSLFRTLKLSSKSCLIFATHSSLDLASTACKTYTSLRPSVHSSNLVSLSRSPSVRPTSPS